MHAFLSSSFEPVRRVSSTCSLLPSSSSSYSLRRRGVSETKAVIFKRTRASAASSWEEDDNGIFQKAGEKLRNESELRVPPGRVGLFGVRETLEYLKDPNAFVKDRVERYGPVFKTAFFFKPAIVFGSASAIEEFKTFEHLLPADAGLPETFRVLHTEYGALRQSGEKHKATRANFKRILGLNALEKYLPQIEKRTEAFVAELKTRGKFSPGADCKKFASETLF